MGVREKDIPPILLVVGARPNFMKIAPLYSELERRGLPQLLLHTGQHYDENMSKIFFDDLGLPEPDIFLGVGSGSHATQTASIMVKFEEVCLEVKPSIVVVVGDVNSTLACTIVAKKMNIPTAHVEAGLRSGDMKMPEEVNRILTDAVADILLTPSIDGNENLIREGRKEEDIFFVGNIMIDSLKYCLERSSENGIFEKLNIQKGEYGVLTLHRPSNVDNASSMESILEALMEIGKIIEIVFPMHPRTRKSMERMGLSNRLLGIPNIRIVEPLGYLEFISIVSNSRVVLTDSGGLQEETTFLKIPCITLRKTTERPITVTDGTNKIVGNKSDHIIEAFNESIKENYSHKDDLPLWDGSTAVRIADIIQRYLEG